MIGYGKNILKLLPHFLILNEKLQEWKIQMKIQTKYFSVAAKSNIALIFPILDFLLSFGRRARTLK